MKIGLKEKITLRGVIRTYTRRQYPGDIYLTESHLEKHTIESLKQLLVGYINQKWLKRFFSYIWNGWLCLASPVLSNTGTDRGLPISCFGIDVADSIQDIGQKI
jgi:Ribonucleotide reductase, alpha subunit